MDTLFPNLTKDEEDVLYFAPPWVALLIAGADDHINSKEIKAGVAFVKRKQKPGEESLIGLFYQVVAEKFLTDIMGYKTLLPEDTEKRNKLLIERLEQLNDIFKKIDLEFAKQYYNDLKDLAISVAEASGGVLGLNPVNRKEKKLISLEMIQEPGLRKEIE